MQVQGEGSRTRWQAEDAMAGGGWVEDAMAAGGRDERAEGRVEGVGGGRRVPTPMEGAGADGGHRCPAGH